EIPTEKSFWIPLAVIIASLSIYFETLLALNIIEQKVYHYTLFYISKTVIEVGLTILFVAVFRLSWERRLYSWLITTIIFSVVSFIYFNRHGFLTKNVSWSYIKSGVIF